MMLKNAGTVVRCIVILLIVLLTTFTLGLFNEEMRKIEPLANIKGVEKVRAAQKPDLDPGLNRPESSDNLDRLDAKRMIADGPDLYVIKYGSWNDLWQIEYVIEFGNAGNQSAAPVDIIDSLPDDTTWTGTWELSGIDSNRISFGSTPGTLSWQIDSLAPGENAEITFILNVDMPGERLLWYTNIVEIQPIAGDLNLGDNSFEDVFFSGGEVIQVHIWLNPLGSSAIWGTAIPGLLVTVTTPGGEFSVLADPGCGGCWNLADVGVLEPGYAINVVAGGGVVPVDITVPDPFQVEVDTSLATVSGEIGGWSERPVEIHERWTGGFQVVDTDSGENFSAIYGSMPRGAKGRVIIVDMISYAEVVFLRPFQSLELVLDVNYAYDWVTGFYEPGHTIQIYVTDDLGALKGQAVLISKFQPELEGESGFSTVIDGWVSLQPDIVPGDWVYGLVDNAYETNVHVGMINGDPDFDADHLDGSISATWIGEQVNAVCEVREEAGPKLDFMVDPNNGSFNCDFQGVGWDLAPDQIVAVTYFEPDDDRVTNIFSGRKIYLPLTLWIDHPD